MPHYMLRASYTADALATLVNQPEDRTAVVTSLVESLGGSIDAFYYALGDNDLFLIIDMPDTITAVAASIAAASGGAVRNVTTTALLTPAEMVAAFTQAGSASYSPPT
jgi:uncharacterized protein with GYD domain